MIKEFVSKYNLPSYRLKQFNQAFYQLLISSYQELKVWPKQLIELLNREIPFFSLKKEFELISKDQSVIKVLFKIPRIKQNIEAVLMKHKDGRNTVCVSCMSGCPVNCNFCATGKLGFLGNLTAREIVDQVLYFQRLLKKNEQRITNIVFMGMGEPLLNLDEVLKAIDIITDPDKLALSDRRITVSTSGYIPQLLQLIDRGYKGRLAISLHAPNQEIRQSIMPVAKVFKLNDLLSAVDKFTKFTNKRVSYEYILISGVNDQEGHANELASLLKARLAHVNLIPYNSVLGVNYKRPSNNQIHKFANTLRKHGIQYSLRVTMGDDIQAACGQLAAKKN